MISGTPLDAPFLRIDVAPTPAHGLQKLSQIMIDKVMLVKRERVGSSFGRLDDETIVAVNRSLALFFGLG